jgi:ABC-type glycerol-3-phosphate transport system permease component
MKRYFGRFLKHVFLLLVSAFVLFPLLYALSASFKSNMEVMLGGAHLIPKEFTLQNYIDAWRLAKFELYTFNSLFIAFFTVTGGIIVSTMTAYVFSRGSFRGKNIIYSIYLGTMFMSVGAITLYPLSRLANKMGILNTAGIIIIQIFSVGALNLLLALGYFKTISQEIDQAAQIDGCSFFRIYWNIIIPLAKPMIATIGLIIFRYSWNDYLMPLVFTMGESKTYPLVVGVVALKDLGGEGAAQWNLMMAGAMFSVIPIVTVYLILNRWFITGLTSGAIKG